MLWAVVEGQGLHRRTYLKEFLKSQPGGSVPHLVKVTETLSAN